MRISRSISAEGDTFRWQAMIDLAAYTGTGIVIHEDEMQKLSCTNELESGIVAYAMALSEALGGSLLGIYIYGSLARGCYHPATSDVDIIVVVRDSYVIPDDVVILQAHDVVGAPVDAVFVTESQVSADVFPTPVSFLMKPVQGHTICHRPEGIGDFLLQRQDAHEAGSTVAGRPACEAIRPVPWTLLAESLDFLLPHIVPSFKNPILMLSRIAYAHTFRRLCSKQDAGEWAAKAFGERWRMLIETALAEYASGTPATGVPRAVLQEYEQYCTGYIGSLRTRSAESPGPEGTG
jgi:predicted nucleotidyltransferase